MIETKPRINCGNRGQLLPFGGSQWGEGGWGGAGPSGLLAKWHEESFQ